MYPGQTRSHPDEDKRKDFLAFTVATRRTLLVTYDGNANLAKVRAMELSDALTILQQVAGGPSPKRLAAPEGCLANGAGQSGVPVSCAGIACSGGATASFGRRSTAVRASA